MGVERLQQEYTDGTRRVIAGLMSKVSRIPVTANQVTMIGFVINVIDGSTCTNVLDCAATADNVAFGPETATFTNATTAATGTYSVTVTVDGCTSAAATTSARQATATPPISRADRRCRTRPVIDVPQYMAPPSRARPLV